MFLYVTKKIIALLISIPALWCVYEITEGGKESNLFFVQPHSHVTQCAFLPALAKFQKGEGSWNKAKNSAASGTIRLIGNQFGINLHFQREEGKQKKSISIGITSGASGSHVEPQTWWVNSSAQPESPRYWFKPPQVARTTAASDSFISRHPLSSSSSWWSFRYVWFRYYWVFLLANLPSARAAPILIRINRFFVVGMGGGDGGRRPFCIFACRHVLHVSVRVSNQ